MIGSCATTSRDCFSLERGTHEFRKCRANDGSKEYQYRMGVQEMLLGNHKSSRDWLKKAARTNPTEKIVRNSSADTLIDEKFKMKIANTEKGNEAAKFILGMIYKEGIGVTKDITRGLFYDSSARHIVLTIKEFENYYNVITYRVVERDLNDNVIEKFELNNFQVTKL